jgi:hypothetical protein
LFSAFSDHPEKVATSFHLEPLGPGRAITEPLFLHSATIERILPGFLSAIALHKRLQARPIGDHAIQIRKTRHI